MLDLDLIFAPDRPAYTVPKKPTPVVKVSDLNAYWHFLWEERAAIMEYDGGMTKEGAEAAALKDILQHMERSGIPLPDT